MRWALFFIPFLLLSPHCVPIVVAPCVYVCAGASGQQQQKFCAKLFTCGDRIGENIYREEQSKTATKHAKEPRDLFFCFFFIFQRSMTIKQKQVQSERDGVVKASEKEGGKETQNTIRLVRVYFLLFLSCTTRRCLCSSCSRLSRRLLVFLRAHRIVTSHVNIDLSIVKRFSNVNSFVCFCRTDGRESPILAESDADAHSDKPRSKYGELVILG